MGFSHWQLDRLRTELSNYRIRKHHNGTARSWEKVLIDVLTSGVTNHVYQEGEEEETFQSESLRRFARGQSVLDASKLNDLWRFFVHLGYLKEGEITEESVELDYFLATRGYLGVRDEEAKKALDDVQGRYVSQRSNGGIVENVELTLVPDSTTTFLYVEESFVGALDTFEKAVPLGHREDEVWSTGRRKGYGFVASPTNLLYAFLRGPSPRDRVNYFQVMPCQGRTFFFHRSGALDPLITSENHETRTMSSSYNLYRFDDERSHPQKTSPLIEWLENAVSQETDKRGKLQDHP